MRGKGQFVCFFLLFSFCSVIPQISYAGEFHRVNARSAIVYDMASGKVLYEQNADAQIAPASLTKILTLYLTWSAIDSGQISLSDRVRVSRRAASMPNVRMGLKAGDIVTVAQLIRGMAVESGNDAAVAMAEYLGGSVENFIAKMNATARELGMTNSHFMTPNGLPARGQITTARDILKVSIAYIRRFPEALGISSLKSYTYNGKTDHNPNNLLGRCPGVDGLKTGFVCASGFNISATAMRDHTRIIAVVLGAQSPGIRCVDAENLIEDAYREIGGPHYAVGGYPHALAAPTCKVAHAARSRRVRMGRRERIRRSRLAAQARARHAPRRRVLKARSVYAAKVGESRVRASRVRPTGKRARCSARARRTAAVGNLARTREHAARHRAMLSRRVLKKDKVVKAAGHRKGVRAGSAKASAKTRGVRIKKGKLAVHKRSRVKTAIKKRRNGAHRALGGNKHVG